MAKVIYDMSEDTRMREMIRMREKALHDKASELASAEKRGRAEGRAEERDKMIKAMRLNGMSDEQLNAIIKNLN